VYLAAGDTDADQIAQRTERLGERIAAASGAVPRFGAGTAETTPETNLGELEREGHLTVRSGATEGTGVIVDPVGARAVRLGRLDSVADGQWTIACDPETVDPGWLAAVLAARLPAAAK